MGSSRFRQRSSCVKRRPGCVPLLARHVACERAGGCSAARVTAPTAGLLKGRARLAPAVRSNRRSSRETREPLAMPCVARGMASPAQRGAEAAAGSLPCFSTTLRPSIPRRPPAYSAPLRALPASQLLSCSIRLTTRLLVGGTCTRACLSPGAPRSAPQRWWTRAQEETARLQPPSMVRVRVPRKSAWHRLVVLHYCKQQANRHRTGAQGLAPRAQRE
mmetsp:Transcript_19077/g.62316  ORF Transcript_19077/g.62316 Transcript_19077/m.62316 type:complete len:218 (-) Transcript_19077:508-1161(-)